MDALAVTDFYWLVSDEVDAAAILVDFVIIIFVFSSTDLNAANAAHNVFLRSLQPVQVCCWMSEWNFDSKTKARGFSLSQVMLCSYTVCHISLKEFIYIFRCSTYSTHTFSSFVRAIFLPLNADVPFNKKCTHNFKTSEKNFSFSSRWVTTNEFAFTFYCLLRHSGCKLNTLLLDAWQNVHKVHAQAHTCRK